MNHRSFLNSFKYCHQISTHFYPFLQFSFFDDTDPASEEEPGHLQLKLEDEQNLKDINTPFFIRF